jgi:hypothetical protein
MLDIEEQLGDGTLSNIRIFYTLEMEDIADIESKKLFQTKEFIAYKTKMAEFKNKMQDIFKDTKNVAHRAYTRLDAARSKLKELNALWFAEIKNKRVYKEEKWPLLDDDTPGLDNVKASLKQWKALNKWIKSIGFRYEPRNMQAYKKWEYWFLTVQWKAGVKLRTSLKNLGNKYKKIREYRAKYHTVRRVGDRPGARLPGSTGAAEESMHAGVKTPYRFNIKSQIAQYFANTLTDVAEIVGYALAELVHEKLTRG